MLRRLGCALIVVVTVFGWSTETLADSVLPGDWVPMGGLRNGCDYASSIEDAAVLPDGDVMVIGNWVTQCVDTAIPAGLARFDVQSGQWSAVPGFQSASAENRIYRVGNQVFVSSGNNVNQIKAEGLPYAYVLKLDLSTGAWSIPGGGVNGGIRAMVSDGQSLFVGGSFTQAGGATAQRLARYDLASGAWHPLGTGAGSTVNALALSDGWLYAGGSFLGVGGVPANRIARMRRSTGEWASLGTGVAGSSSSITAIAVSGHTVHVTGTFSQVGDIASNRIAAWIESGNEGGWHPIGVRGISTSAISRLIALPGRLYAVGTSELALWVPAGPQHPGIQPPGQWDHVASVSGFGTAGLGFDALADGQDIYLFGNIWRVNGLRANGIVRYDTTASMWHLLGNGSSQAVTRAEGSDEDRIWALQVVGDKLLAGGRFEEVGGVPSDGFAMWNGEGWTNLSGDGHDGRPSTVGSVLALGQDDIIVEGSWQPTPTSHYQGLARCSITRLANPIPGAGQPPCASVGGGASGVYTMLRAGDTVIVGGWFSQVGTYSGSTIQASNLAKYNLSLNTWSAFGSGADRYPVSALVRLGDDVYVGGGFNAIDGVPASRIARLDLNTGSWHALGTGLVGDVVNAMAVIDGHVYVGGRFSSAGGIPARNIARWSPATGQWSALDQGIYDTYGVISMLADDHRLYVGGYFTHANGASWQTGSIPARHIAAWDSVAGRWLALPGGGVQSRTSARVSTLERYRGAVYAGGSFTDAGEMASRHFAAFIPAADQLFVNGFDPPSP